MKAILVEDNLAEARLTQFAFESVAPSTELVHCENGQFQPATGFAISPAVGLGFCGAGRSARHGR